MIWHPVCTDRSTSHLLLSGWNREVLFRRRSGCVSHGGDQLRPCMQKLALCMLSQPCQRSCLSFVLRVLLSTYSSKQKSVRQGQPACDMHESSCCVNDFTPCGIYLTATHRRTVTASCFEAQIGGPACSCCRVLCYGILQSCSLQPAVVLNLRCLSGASSTLL
jgi:hypothetical protein